jgi:hypothetical protein
MDYEIEAKKFIWRAQDTDIVDEKSRHLEMAEWCLTQATEKRSGHADQEAPN